MFLNYFSDMDNWPYFKLSGYKTATTIIIGLIISKTAYSFDFHAATNQLHADLNKGDSAKFCQHFLPEAQLHHLGEEGLETLALKDFSPVLKKFSLGEYREVFTQVSVNELQTGLTYVDVHFDFYINEKLAFSGIDHVIWIEHENTFKIASLYTGTLKPKFTTATGETGEIALLKTLLDSYLLKWHNDVATYRFEDYFGFMTDDFIFLGTDPSERWTKEEFKKFCQPYFDKKSTWDFKTNWRNWYVSDDNQVAWFEESLDTWMDECRGSGVLVNQNGQWKIAHYNLSVLIENSKVDKFIKLRKK